MPTSEDAWHRNLRRSRQSAKGILAAVKLGLDIPEATVEAAKCVLFEHHATDADTMPSWTAQQKMQNRISQLENMMNGNYHATPNQKGMMPWGKGGNPGGKGGSEGGGKDGKGGGKGGGGKGGNAAQNLPGPCCRCGGMHTKSQCSAFLEQKICQNCCMPEHLKSQCRNATVDENTACQ